MIQDCPKCRRKKVIMGLGAILKTCPECKGVGYIKIDEDVVNTDEVPLSALVSKRGRPKKVNDDRA